MAPVLKTGIPERVSGVRIPPSPPVLINVRKHWVLLPEVPPEVPISSKRFSIPQYQELTSVFVPIFFNSGLTFTAAFEAAAESPFSYLARHEEGDWGDLDEHDVKANAEALVHGLRLLSSYGLSNGMKIWVITEADRSATTVLLQEEY